MIDLQSFTRAVWREGRVVCFQNIVGPFAGREYRYKFPTARQATAFEKLAERCDERGCPAAVPERYKKYAQTAE